MKLTIKSDKELDALISQALLENERDPSLPNNSLVDGTPPPMVDSAMVITIVERRRRNNENGIKRKIERMLKEERMHKIITELSKEMDARKRQWLDLARRNEQCRREDTVVELTGDYQRAIEQTEDMIMELDNFYLEVLLIDVFPKSKIQSDINLA